MLETMINANSDEFLVPVASLTMVTAKALNNLVMYLSYHKSCQDHPVPSFSQEPQGTL